MSHRKRKRRAQQDLEALSSKRIAAPRNSSTIQHIDDQGDITQVTTRLGLKKHPELEMIPLSSPTLKEATLADDTHTLGNEEGGEGPEVGDESKTQTRAVIDEFMKHEDMLQNGIFENYNNPFHDELCPCGSKLVRNTSCFECFQILPRCSSCFALHHRNIPLHWARVWDTDDQCFKKRDYASLYDSLFIQLGHEGDPVECKGGAPPIIFTITHTNGIHGTRLRFCACPGAPNRVSQLLRARLFPATITDPRSAFTFQVLKNFHLLNMQTKCSTFDYNLSLRRMTDNIFTDRVPDTYKAFLRVSRIWDYLSTRRLAGQTHNISQLLPHRPPESITLYCPSCPEPGVNVPISITPLPPEFRHLLSVFLTVDGNFQMNRFSRNTDPKDTSLWKGCGYMPTKEDYQLYLNGIPVSREKSVCNFITAVNAQDRKKFRMHDETGMINVMCSHVYVVSSVDMYLGERFAYTDYALSRALETRSLSNVAIDVSYDSSCSYSVNAKARFEKQLPNTKELVSRTRFTIDSLHVHDHIPKCMYLFSTHYQEGIGHFHGVGTEQFWAEQNQLGGQIRQMNPGGRHDKVTSHFGDWNKKKLVRHARTLAHDLLAAQSLYVKKRDEFRRKSETYVRSIPEWSRMDCSPKLRADGQVESVYCHTATKPTSAESVRTRLVHMSLTTPPAHASLSPFTQVSHFLKEGIAIEAKQLSVCLLVKQHTAHPLASTKESIRIARDELTTRIERWRGLQIVIMSSLTPSHVAQIPNTIEQESLFLPSQFSHQDRISLSFELLAVEEARLRIANASDCILQLRRVSRIISGMHRIRKVDVRGQKEGTRSRTSIQSAIYDRDHLLELYTITCLALQSLDPNLNHFPPLNANDLYLRPVDNHRQINDTYRSDGPIWGLTSSHSSSSSTQGLLNAPERSSFRPSVITAGGRNPQHDPSSATTQMIRRQAASPAEPLSDRLTSLGGATRTCLGAEGPHEERVIDMQIQPSTSPDSTAKEGRVSGRLWDPLIGLSEREVEEWEQQENRVEWHRSRAEMMRWLEEYELKHVEFQRCIESFRFMRNVWTSLAAKSPDPGHSAFANRQSSVYRELQLDAELLFKSKGLAEFVECVPGDMGELVRAVREFRRRELGWLTELGGHPPTL